MRKSLSCATKFVGVPKPASANTGFEATKQGAADALKGVLAQHEEWRDQVLATVGLSGMPSDVERNLRKSQPTPTKGTHRRR
ncbi:hypothetical protein MMMDOFMJ_3461 [Methylobacterium gnaphalii]|uniref:Uncharacterized protein n=1 Tax=Methylobacterium gnaphalii TaxID=1010610 RepID=A0A512JR62_9HYPH|nr:hypothetical protein MGN01_42910 [Methylobacterium gnaphalii]GJD70512.1 hypothetical protein MMMDOFMJ_3461 [Methylobacterium gnaphalii]GLS48874.1 hypothetical protein GCM10007885_17210 [Methylobacterium gnaphalii]